MIDYSERLKSPFWQKRRLEILNRDNFSCQLCGDNEATLHVHHKEYISGREPWDYPDDNFITYCKYCHALVESHKGYKVELLTAIKRYSQSHGAVFIWSIYHETEYAELVLSIDRLFDDMEILNVVRISQKAFMEMSQLFQTCEKLIINGKRSSNTLVLE